MLLMLCLALSVLPLLIVIWWRLTEKPVDSNGYALRKLPSGEARYEHRELAEEILGRRLESREVVHHINGRRSDNRLKNLCVMDRRDHERYHEWYDWIYKTYGKYPRRETQLKKLTGDFKGILLVESIKRGTGT